MITSLFWTTKHYVVTDILSAAGIIGTREGGRAGREKRTLRESNGKGWRDQEEKGGMERRGKKEEINGSNILFHFIFNILMQPF